LRRSPTASHYETKSHRYTHGYDDYDDYEESEESEEDGIDTEFGAA